MTDDDDPDAWERERLALEDRQRRRYATRLRAAPDCRDPDHPGCAHCEDYEESEE